MNLTIIKYKHNSGITLIPTIKISNQYATVWFIGIEFLNFYFGISVPKTQDEKRENE